MRRMSKFRLFGKFSKVTAQDDGTLVVEGVASSESVDSQGEVVRADAMRGAIPDFMKFGNIREMHQPIAAGKAIDISVGEDGITRLSAHVVDAESCKKVSAGVLQGFSIGGFVPPGGRSKDDANVIETIKLTEISLVDRPANPDALITLVKVDTEPVQTSATPAPAEEAKKAEATPVSPAPAPAVVRKGMWTVGRAAELLAALAALQQDTAWEAECEGDSSPVPGQLKAQVDALASTLRDLVAEETAELQASLKPVADVPVTAAAPAGETQKASEPPPAGAEAPKPAAGEPAQPAKVELQVSMPDAAAIQRLVESPAFLKAWREAAAPPPAPPPAEDLQKRVADAEAATAAAGEALKKVMAERDALATELGKAKTQLAAKGALRVVPVSKGQDGGATVDEPAAPPEGTVARAEYEVRKIHASGGRRLV